MKSLSVMKLKIKASDIELIKNYEFQLSNSKLQSAQLFEKN